MTPERRQQLLSIARDSIDRGLKGQPPPQIFERPHAQEATHGIFVTLRLRGELRGCIGTLVAEEGLAKAASEFACNAAFHDPRFPPLTLPEWPEVSIEISVMTPPRPVAAEEVEVGRHGLILEFLGRRGLLLPQVATEWSFSREQFLEALAQKAGLPPGAWRDPGAKLFGFEAEVFGEEQRGA
jgi:AmmeMemoRadiSam system protein A